LALIFAAVNQAGLLKNFAQKKSVSSEDFTLLLKVLAQIPVKSEKLSAELAEFVKDGFTCIQNFYLDHA